MESHLVAKEYGAAKTKIFLREYLVDLFTLVLLTKCKTWERKGSVVKCLSRDREAAGSNLTSLTALCP